MLLQQDLFTVFMRFFRIRRARRVGRGNSKLVRRIRPSILHEVSNLYATTNCVSTSEKTFNVPKLWWGIQCDNWCHVHRSGDDWSSSLIFFEQLLCNKYFSRDLNRYFHCLVVWLHESNISFILKENVLLYKFLYSGYLIEETCDVSSSRNEP